MTLGSSTNVLGVPPNASHPTTPPFPVTKRTVLTRPTICRAPILNGGRRPLRSASAASVPYTVAGEPVGGSERPYEAENVNRIQNASEFSDPDGVSRSIGKPFADTIVATTTITTTSCNGRNCSYAQPDSASSNTGNATHSSDGDGGAHGVGASVTLEGRILEQVSEQVHHDPNKAAPDMLLLPVAVCKTITLAAQATLSDGVLSLLRQLPITVADHATFPSGVLRLEVAVPRTATTALRWLSGQQYPHTLLHHHHNYYPQQQQQQASESSSPAAGGPFLYFSGRRSSAPDTPGAAEAEAATRGWSSVAGAGAAWQWWGPGSGGGGFDSHVVSAMQRFLSPDQPRVRILGGVRFDPRRTPGPEWALFGSHCFVLPLLELTDAEDCCLLAVTLAWDPAAAAAAMSEGNALAGGAPSAGAGAGAGAFFGCADLEIAATRAEMALREMRPPAPASAYGLRLNRSEPHHSPSKEEWDAHMATLLGGLQEGHDMGAPAAAALASLLDTGLARQEYLTHGQQGLDDLLAALTLSASTTNAVRRSAGGDVGDGLDQLRDLIDGKVTVSELTATTAVAAAPPGGGSQQAGDEAAEDLSKVVMARRTTMRIEGLLDPLHVLQSLQERDPRAYQLYFAPGSGFGGTAGAATGNGNGPAFLACTPERLYARTGRFVASEAVAGTRPRGRGGDVEQDFWLSLDLLRSAKDHAEFCTVRDWIASQLAGPCEDVRVEIRKSILKQGSVQHLFGRVAAALRRGRNDAHLLAALHPTPAVCGRPREAALGYLEELESFDRGWYAGPFGWISGAGAEFVVAIRSGLVCPASGVEPNEHAEKQQQQQQGQQLQGQQHRNSNPVPVPPAALVHMFAGVGVVRGSDPAAEWQELDLKIRPLSSALLAAPLPSAAPNLNVAWAGLLVEELCRLGVNMFCVAPGSRSSPLTHAIASHPRARLNVCIDERSLGFWALGYGRASGRPAAVVTSSGTAVANLLPAVVEASLSGVPLLLLTADRPAELRDTAANQTIDQTKIFGGFVRWFFDLPPPAAGIPGRTVLTTASTAYRAAVASCPPGPVHLNLQFREPLAPVATPWAPGPFLEGLNQWQASQLPYTSHISGAALPGALPSAVPALKDQPWEGVLGPSGTGLMSYVFGGGSSSADVTGLRALLRSARRGLVVVGELTDPRDVVAARQIGSILGWPVVADVLSGLRVGAAPKPTIPQATQPQLPRAYDTLNLYDNAVPLVHHMDHLLLGDRAWRGQLRPDVILQLGPHLTSKRLGEFMDWAALGEGGGAGAGVPWVYVASHTLRHDPSHLVTHRVVMALPEFRDTVAGPAAATSMAAVARPVNGGVTAAAAVTDPWVHVSSYGRLLLQLDEAVSQEIDAALSSLESISEPFIARALARSLPAGHGLFIGNSMPIRDMDMYASPPLPPPLTSMTSAAVAGGVPVAANRGASGIDGVLSTAAGFAEGLSRPATLLVGDLSFLHDVNGLNLLRAGELRPPLTVVLINNAGGGIFSFLPIASSVPDEQFTPLWATPQNVDLEAMCRAQGIPHQKVTTPEGLIPALQAAWGLNRHSVVEVTTDRSTNVDLHRRIQAAALRAAQHCHWLVSKMDFASSTSPSTSTLSPAPPFPSSARMGSYGALDGPQGGCSTLVTEELQWRRYSLPLARPLTTSLQTSNIAAVASEASLHQNKNCNYKNNSGGGSDQSAGFGVREGLIVRLRLLWTDGSVAGEGVGEVAPLPGLHSETLEEAEVQVAALSGLLAGVAVPPSLALLGGRLGAWLDSRVGVDPAWLLPSVRFGLECALLSALAAALRMPMTDLIAPPPPQLSPSSSSPASLPRRGTVLLNGLLSPPVSGDDAADAMVAAAAAVRLVSEGYTAIKVKVARRSNPEADAAVLAAVRAAVGPHIVLRADANRGWGELAAAVAFGRAAVAAGVGLQYVEEPTSNPREDLAAFYRHTGVPVAADESLDEGLLAAPPPSVSTSTRTGASSSFFSYLNGGGSGSGGGGGSGNDARTGASAPGESYSAAGLPMDRTAGLAAVVVKPAVLGGLETAMETARWAQRRGIQVVISSAFESSVGMAALLQLAAAIDSTATTGGGGGGGGSPAVVHHGLGTLQWFTVDVSAEPLQLAPQRLPSMLMSMSASMPSPTSASVSRGPASASQATAVEFPPLQALCGTVDQADQLLQACAAGWGLRREAPMAAGADEAADVSARAGPTHGSPADDAWAGPPYTHGGVLERPFVLDVAIPSSSSSSSSSGSLNDPLFVQVQGLEIRPPAYSSVSPSSSSDGAAAAGSQRKSQLWGRRPFLFLHGFLGSSSDWRPVMRALAAAGHRCIAIDLPGHGGTLLPPPTAPVNTDSDCSNTAAGIAPVHSISGAACCVAAAARRLDLGGAVLVGYSLGARVALQAAVDDAAAGAAEATGGGTREGSGNDLPTTRDETLWSGVVLVSGTPGIKDPAQAAARAANDERLSRSLLRNGVEDFIRRWYEQPLWASLRRHPAFGRMLARRHASTATAPHRDGFVTTAPSAALVARQDEAVGAVRAAAEMMRGDRFKNIRGGALTEVAGSCGGGGAASQLAAALSGMSTGRMAPLWDRLDPWAGPPVVLVVGDLDAKFVDINTYTLARLVRQRAAAAAATTLADTGGGHAPATANPMTPPSLALPWVSQQQQQHHIHPVRSTMPVSEQLRQLGHALIRVVGVGHAVHVEAPERLLDLLQETVRTLEGLERSQSGSEM